MRGIKRMIAAVLCLLLLGGCAMDVESYLKPPRAQGEQQALQQALEAAILKETTDHYTFKYPASGAFTSAFVLLDSTGNVSEVEEAVTAVAFYTYGGGEYTHLHLLRRDGDGWYSVSDLTGEYTDIDVIQVCDLNGDGQVELSVGWKLYSGERRLCLYQLDTTGIRKLSEVGRYHRFFAGDMTADGWDDLVLLSADAPGTVTASLYVWLSPTVRKAGETRLNDAIQSFDNLLYGKLTSGVEGLYIDATLNTGHYISEILYWDGIHLQAPLSDPAVQNSTVSTRIVRIFSMDVDGNGVPEFPVTSRLSTLPQASGENTWQWLTEWMSWDVASQKAVRQFGSIVNLPDGYFIELEDEWIATVTTRYDEDTRTLWLEAVQKDGTPEPFLAVQNTENRDNGQPAEGYIFVDLPGNDNLRIWYDPDSEYRLTTEKISYMLVTFN